MKSHKRIDEQQAYDMWLECLNSAIKSVVSMVLYIVIQRKWHRYNVIALFDDIVETINTPIKVFGKEVDDLYIQDYKYIFHFPHPTIQLKLSKSLLYF